MGSGVTAAFEVASGGLGRVTAPTVAGMNAPEIRAGQRWAARNGIERDIQIVGRATEFDGWAVTWQGIGQSNVELWPTSRIVEHYVLAAEHKRAGTGQLTTLS